MPHHLHADLAGVGRLVDPVGDIADPAQERRRAALRLQYCWLERYIRAQSLNGLGMSISPWSVAEELAELLSDSHRLAHPLPPAVECCLRVRRVPPALLGEGDHA